MVALVVKNLPAMQETGVLTLGWEDPLERCMMEELLRYARHWGITVNLSPVCKFFIELMAQFFYCVAPRAVGWRGLPGLGFRARVPGRPAGLRWSPSCAAHFGQTTKMLRVSGSPSAG